MKEVAACFDRQVLRQVPEDLFWARMGELRGRVCDRALLRAAHFFEEDRRTAAFEDALAQNDIPQILSLFAASGRSSQQLLQNEMCIRDRSEDSRHGRLPVAKAQGSENRGHKAANGC